MTDAAALAGAIAGPTPPTSVLLRQGIVSAVGGDGSLALVLGAGGTIATRVPTLQPVAVGDLVWVLVNGPDMIVAGRILDEVHRGRNALHNGRFLVSQRGDGPLAASTNATTGRMGPDRWMVWRAGFVAGAEWQRADTANLPMRGHVRVFRISGNTATDIISLGQALESVDSMQFRGRQTTLSFYARCGADYSPASDALAVLVNSGTGTDESVNSTFTGNISEASTTVTLTTDWQRFTVPIEAMSADLTQVKVTFQATPVGTAGANDWFDITGVQLEVGGVTPFEIRSYADELAVCRRYFKAWPAQSAGGVLPFVGMCTATTTAQVWVNHDIPMRIQPILCPTPTVTDYAVLNASGTRVVATAVALASLTDENGSVGSRIDVTVASGLTAGNATAMNYSANAVVGDYLGLSAEL